MRDLEGLGPNLGAIGDLELRLATTKREIRKAQKLRYRVFFEEGGAAPDSTARLIRRDVCRFDRVCDHLIVVDRAGRRGAKVVGAYRLLRQDVAEANFGFYSAGEFDVAPLLARHRQTRFLELGRSCVAPGYRARPTLELLWRGVWAYVRHHRIDAMFGCASLDGAEPAAHAAALSLLWRSAPASAEWGAAAVGRGFEMAAAPQDGLDARAAARALPPLVRGYWRLGAKFGAQAVVDPKFGTTDVFVVMPIADIEARYLARFAPRGQAAALAARPGDIGQMTISLRAEMRYSTPAATRRQTAHP
ncbi:MAG: GNAT family N-acyltransferase [Roseiarcus sp.]